MSARSSNQPRHRCCRLRRRRLFWKNRMLSFCCYQWSSFDLVATRRQRISIYPLLVSVFFPLLAAISSLLPQAHGRQQRRVHERWDDRSPWKPSYQEEHRKLESLSLHSWYNMHVHGLILLASADTYAMWLADLQQTSAAKGWRTTG